MSKKFTLILACIMLSCEITFAQPTPPTITGNTIYCPGQTISLTANSPAPAPTFTWTGPGIAGSYTGATLTIAGASVTIAGAYNVTVTSAGSTSTPATANVVVNNKPSLPYVNPDSINYCQGDNSVILNAIGANLLWYTTAAGGVGSSVAPTPSTSIPGLTYYYVTQTVNGCESDRVQIAINVKVKPGQPGVSNIVYCQNSMSLPLQAGGTGLRWYLGSSGGVGSPVAPTPGTDYSGIQYYYVTQTINGCESDRAQVKVTVNYTPNALIVSSAPYVCQYDTLQLSYFGNAASTASFDWTLPPGASFASGSGSGPVFVRFNSPGPQVVLLVVQDNGCKSPVTSYNVIVNQIPQVPVNVKTDACLNEVVNVSLGNANEHIDNYAWDFNGGNIVYATEGGGPYGVTWGYAGLHTVSMTATTNGCPSVTVKDTINIHSLPDAHIASVSDNNICAGDSVSFTAERYDPAYLYQWLPAAYFGNNTNTRTAYAFITDGYTVYLKVTTQYGCTSEDSTIIITKPCCEVYFPDAFTPNGDGKNDFFRPIAQANQQVKTFTVVNRWGQVVYETTDLRQGWDGMHNGVPQDMGTYMYFIRYICANGRTYDKKGELLLIR